MNIKTHTTALTHDGRGVAQVEGKTVFIEGALPNEEVLFSYTKRHGKYDEGKIVEIVTPSPDRVTPLCPHFEICGGCALQHFSSSGQIAEKQKTLLQQLKHFGNTQPENILEPLTGSIWGYRRRARISVKYVIKKQKVLVGYHEKNGRYIAELTHCETLHPKVGHLITPLKEFIRTLDAYQQIPQIEVAVGDNATGMVFRNLEPLSDKDIEKLNQFAIEHDLHIYLQPKGPDSTYLIWPPDQTTDLLSYQIKKHNLELDFHPTNFIQINAEINDQMIDRALNLLELTKDDRVLDLFCGLGNFTLPIAKYCQEVVGVEGDTDLVKKAQHNAAKNNIHNAEFHKIDLNTDFSQTTWAQGSFTKILLDPPRTGALEAVQQIIKFKAKKIVYVSCNPATLARDAKELVQAGYRLTHAGVMDMFPHTHHIEAIALFEM